MIIDLDNMGQLPEELQDKMKEAAKHLKRLQAAYSLAAASRNLDMRRCCMNRCIEHDAHSIFTVFN